MARILIVGGGLFALAEAFASVGHAVSRSAATLTNSLSFLTEAMEEASARRRHTTMSVPFHVRRMPSRRLVLIPPPARRRAVLLPLPRNDPPIRMPATEPAHGEQPGATL